MSSKEIDELLFHFFKDIGYVNPKERIKDVSIISDYSIEEGIFAYSQLMSVDVIAIPIPTHGCKGLSHLLKGSISEDVANHAMIPVLTIKLSNSNNRLKTFYNIIEGFFIFQFNTFS